MSTDPNDPGASNRGAPAKVAPDGSVHGSGAGAGGGNPEDFDSDVTAGAGGDAQPREGDRPASGGDAPSHGSR